MTTTELALSDTIRIRAIAHIRSGDFSCTRSLWARQFSLTTLSHGGSARAGRRLRRSCWDRSRRRPTRAQSKERRIPQYHWDCPARDGW
jgi:hypothetical protein